MKFFTQYKRPDKKQFYEVNSGDIKVSKDYVPLKAQIETLTQAGIRLAEYRRSQFHFAEGEKVPDDFIDLTTAPGIEPPDVQSLTEVFRDRLKANKQIKTEKVQENPEEEPEEAPEENKKTKEVKDV